MDADAYIATHANTIEKAISRAVNAAITKRAADPVRFLTSHLQSESAPFDAFGIDTAHREKVSAVLHSAKARAAQAEGPKMPPNAAKVDAWSTSAWISGLGTSQLVADALLSPLRSLDAPADEASTLELAYMRALALDGSKETLGLLLAQLLPSLTDVLWKGLQKLGHAKAATSAELHSKFLQEEGTIALSYGGLSNFFSGLEGLIGPPQPNLNEAMAREHCDAKDSTVPFEVAAVRPRLRSALRPRARPRPHQRPHPRPRAPHFSRDQPPGVHQVTNYGTTTTSATEWWYVTDPDGGLPVLGLTSWPLEENLVKIRETRMQCRIAKVRAARMTRLQPTRD